MPGAHAGIALGDPGLRMCALTSGHGSRYGAARSARNELSPLGRAVIPLACHMERIWSAIQRYASTCTCRRHCRPALGPFREESKRARGPCDHFLGASEQCRASPGPVVHHPRTATIGKYNPSKHGAPTAARQSCHRVTTATGRRAVAVACVASLKPNSHVLARSRKHSHHADVAYLQAVSRAGQARQGGAVLRVGS